MRPWTASREWSVALGARAPQRWRTTLLPANADAEIRSLEMSPFQRLLSAIAHPNIAYVLMTLGGLGLYFELSNPGEDLEQRLKRERRQASAPPAPAGDRDAPATGPS